MRTANESTILNPVFSLKTSASILKKCTKTYFSAMEIGRRTGETESNRGVREQQGPRIPQARQSWTAPKSPPEDSVGVTGAACGRFQVGERPQSQEDFLSNAPRRRIKGSTGSRRGATSRILAEACLRGTSPGKKLPVRAKEASSNLSTEMKHDQQSALGTEA